MRPRTKALQFTASGAGSTELVAAVAGRRIVVYGYQVMSDSEEDGFFEDSAEEQLSLTVYAQARGGIVGAHSPEGLFYTDLGVALHFNQSGGEWSGNVQYSYESGDR